MNDAVTALAVDGSGNLYVGGSFLSTFDGPVGAFPHIAKWNTSTSTWSALGAGLSEPVYALAISGTDVYAGGVFTTTYGTGGDATDLFRVGKWNGIAWSGLGTGIYGANVRTLAVDSRGTSTRAGNSLPPPLSLRNGTVPSGLPSGQA